MKHLDHKLSYGPFTNTELIELAAKTYLNAEDLINLIVPKNKDTYPMLMDVLNQLGRRNTMLKNEQDINQSGVERLMPLLRSDGVLHLSNLILDSDYTNQILNFFCLLRVHPII